MDERKIYLGHVELQFYIWFYWFWYTLKILKVFPKDIRFPKHGSSTGSSSIFSGLKSWFPVFHLSAVPRLENLQNFLTFAQAHLPVESLMCWELLSYPSQNDERISSCWLERGKKKRIAEAFRQESWFEGNIWVCLNMLEYVRYCKNENNGVYKTFMLPWFNGRSNGPWAARRPKLAASQSVSSFRGS
jgi:hypothetical protein